MNQKGGDYLLELLYRIDERVKSMDRSMGEMKVDIAEVKKTVGDLSKQVTMDHARLDEIEDSVKTVRRVSVASIVGALMGLIINK